MKYNTIAAVIMLLAGAIAAFICLINRASALFTVQCVFYVLVVFCILGFVAQKFIRKITEAAEREAEKREAERIALEERAKKEAEEQSEDFSLDAEQTEESEQLEESKQQEA